MFPGQTPAAFDPTMGEASGLPDESYAGASGQSSDSTPEDDDMTVLEAQWDRYQRGRAGHDRWAEEHKLNTDFLEGKQWSEADRAALEEEGRPVLTWNQIRKLWNYIIGNFVQNRYEISYKPGNDGTGVQAMAEIYTALAKQIDEANQGNWLDKEVFEDGLRGGRGFWDIRINRLQNQKGTVQDRAVDPATIIIDPEAESYSPEDWTFVTEQRWWSIEEILMYFGQKAAKKVLSKTGNMPIMGSLWDDRGSEPEITPERWFGLATETNEFWRTGASFTSSLNGNLADHLNRYRRLVRVISTQHRCTDLCYFFTDLDTGDEKIIDTRKFSPTKAQEIQAYAQTRGFKIALRQGIRRRWRWTVTAADMVLWDDFSPYRTPTIVPYFAYFRRGKTRGMIDDLRDPQSEINKRKASILHILTTAANSGWIYYSDALSEESKNAIEEHGSRPGINLEVVPGKEAPQRIQPGQPPTGLMQYVQQSEESLGEIAGINETATATDDRVQSGRSMLLRQKAALLGAENYFDNFSRSRELKGRKYKELVQDFYTEERMVLIRGTDGKDVQQTINRMDAAGEIANNIRVGNYEVMVEEAPLSQSFIQGQFTEAMEMREKGIPIPDDIIIKLSSLPNKDEVLRRMEEDRIRAIEIAKIQAAMVKVGAGLDPSQPAPPTVGSDGPSAIAMPAGGLPPMTPQGPASPLNGGARPAGGVPPASAGPAGQSLEPTGLPAALRPGAPGGGVQI